MSSVEKNLVCIICLKRFTLYQMHNENKPITENLNPDPYTKFLLFVSRYFNLGRLAGRFLESGKQAKAENGEPANLQPFCDNCGELVNSVCKIYKELQVLQMFLVWKLSKVEEALKMSKTSVSYKLSMELLSCMAKQINVKSVRPVTILRKSIQLKCIAAKRKSMPIIPVHKGLFPDEWKFTYAATKEALIQLIAVFTLSLVKIPGKSVVRPEITGFKRANVAKRRLGPPTKIMKPSRDETNRIAGKNEDHAADSFKNDFDWSRGSASPMSTRSVSSDDDDDDTQRATCGLEPVRKIRGRRNVVVQAEEEGAEVDLANSKWSGIDLEQSVSRKKKGTGKRRGRPPSSSLSSSQNRWIRRPPTQIEKKFKQKRSKVKLSCNFQDCGAFYSYSRLLGNHLEEVHETGKPEAEKTIQCCYCSQRYAYHQSYDMHLRTKHKRKLFHGFKCDFEDCTEKPFVSMEELNEHLKNHMGQSEQISFCDKCNWGFVRQALRDLHQLVHIKADMEDGKFGCPQCLDTFAHWGTLRDHFNKEHGLNLRPFKCDQCSKSFYLENSLQIHKQYHIKLKEKMSHQKLKCDQCGVTLVDEDTFKKHINSGHWFRCPEPGCDQKFNTNRKLQIHRTMKHVVKREWICEICGNQFADNDSLRKHRKLHGEKKFSCEFCGAAFPKKTKLNSHVESMHNPNRVKKWICSLCGKSYHTDTGLQYHTDSEHRSESEWNLKCPNCPRRFYRNLYLYKHLKTCTGKDAIN